MYICIISTIYKAEENAETLNEIRIIKIGVAIAYLCIPASVFVAIAEVFICISNIAVAVAIFGFVIAIFLNVSMRCRFVKAVTIRALLLPALWYAITVVIWG